MRPSNTKPSYRIREFVSVPAALVDLRRVRRDLTFEVEAKNGVAARRLRLWRERPDGTVLVPRHYRIPYLNGKAVDVAFLKLRDDRPQHAGRIGNVAHSIVPRDVIQVEAINALKKPGDKILALSCGKGKTLVSIAAAVEAGRLPLLIVVNSQTLMTQWRKELKRWLSRNGRPVKVGHIQRDVAKWRGFPVAVAMLHSLVQRDYPQEFYDNWAVVLFDECHNLGAYTFSKAAALFAGERWGLTATLHREDGHDKLIQLHLGPVAYENLTQSLVGSTYFVRSGISVAEKRFVKWRSSRTNLPKLTTHLSADAGRNAQIMYLVNRALKDGRTVLVLGERVEQLQVLCDSCTVKSKSILIGSLNEEARSSSLKKRAVFATQHIAKEGLDRPEFDTLFVLFPFGGEGRLRQSWGRILRVVDGKKRPVIFVFEDDITVMRRLANKMRAHLDALNWPHFVMRAGSSKAARVRAVTALPAGRRGMGAFRRRS